MKTVWKVCASAAKAVGILILVVIVLLILLLVWLSVRPMAPNDYTRTVKTGGEIEAKYLAMGPYKVKHTQAEAPGDWEKFYLYYPAALSDSEDTWPVVVLVNGTGIGGSKYKAVFRHLASWGFIVLGSEDPSTCTGASADAVLAYLLSEDEREGSVFYRRVDRENIGAAGHSQGGVGVFNAVTVNEHSGLYKTAVALSPTNEEGAAVLGMDYDLTKLTIPTLMLAGTVGEFETELVIPLEQMERMYGRMDVPKAMARRRDSEHGGMLYQADGYVTAWLMWQLQGDEAAAGAFQGAEAELLGNPQYQDQRSDCQ